MPCYSSLFSSLRDDDDRMDGCSTLSNEQKAFRGSLIPKLRVYNTYYSQKPCQISCREVRNSLKSKAAIHEILEKRPLQPRSFIQSYQDCLFSSNKLLSIRVLCPFCKTPTKEPTGLAVNSNFHRRRPHSGFFDPKFDASTTLSLIHIFCINLQFFTKIECDTN